LPKSASDLGLPNDVSGWDRLSTPIWLFDPVALRGVYANAPALVLWGADSREELLARDFSSLSEAVLTRLERLVQATAGGATITERWSFYPRGRPVTVRALISALTLPDGQRVLLFEATKAEVEEEELRAVEAIRHSSSLVSLFDAKGRPTFANPAAFSAYGETGRDFVARFRDPEHGAATLARILKGEVLAELRQVDTAQGERSHHLDARRVIDPVTGEACVMLSERDVTAQVEAERALVAAQERAEAATLKERFLSRMSHELRTPLTSVLGFAGLLRATGLNEAQSRHLERIAESGETLLRMVNDVIDLSDLDRGELKLDLAPFDPRELLARVGDRFEPAARAKGLAFVLDTALETPTIVIGDGERLGKVIAHYLDNAVKLTDRGEVRVSLTSRAAATGAATLELTVADTGPGVDPATGGRLFQRLDPAGDDQGRRFGGGGGGLGLALCRRLMALMGGEVGVDSTPGAGARFWLRVTLPIDTGAVRDSEVEAVSEAEPDVLKVLYADDHANNRVLVQAVLATQGHLCETVCDGAEAVAAARAGDYDLILMDIQMPVMDGVSAAREIRGLPGPRGRTPILALTANTLAEQKAAYAAAGMNDCLAKPVNMGELLTKSAYWARAGAVAREADRTAA
jgi:signal transduction histidine kinase/ActR/RegA family two-component response regulator